MIPTEKTNLFEQSGRGAFKIDKKNWKEDEYDIWAKSLNFILFKKICLRLI
jgi:hypothetical protein